MIKRFFGFAYFYYWPNPLAVCGLRSI